MEMMLIYTPLSLDPIKTIVQDIKKDASGICNGFEIVRVQRLEDIVHDAVFITSDLYSNKDSVNFVGTYLYDFADVYIKGNICICKCVYGELLGLTDPEGYKIEKALSLNFTKEFMGNYVK